MKIKWNKVTWYSKLGALIVFLLGVPLLAFYIGIQYEKTRSVLNSVQQVQEVNVQSLKTYRNETYGFEFKYPSNLTYTENLLGEKDFVVLFSYNKPGYTLIITASPINDFISASGQEPSYYEKETNELVTYDSVNKKKIVLREKPTVSQNGWEGFYLFSTLVVPNEKTGYTISIDESATPEGLTELYNSLVKESFRLI